MLPSLVLLVVVNDEAYAKDSVPYGRACRCFFLRELSDKSLLLKFVGNYLVALLGRLYTSVHSQMARPPWPNKPMRYNLVRCLSFHQLNAVYNLDR